MSVVVWDGKTLAADCQGTTCDMRVKTSKIEARHFASGTVVCAVTGESGPGAALMEWYFCEADPKEWPAFQNDKEDWTRLIVARRGECFVYERICQPIPVMDEFMAWGSGRDFAMGALAMGADARTAVEVASRFSTTCGMGVEAYDL